MRLMKGLLQDWNYLEDEYGFGVGRQQDLLNGIYYYLSYESDFIRKEKTYLGKYIYNL